MQFYGQIGVILPFSGDHYVVCLIQAVNNGLLNGFIYLIIQSIDTDSFLENGLKIWADRRLWKCDDGKAGLLSRNILVHHLGGVIGIS